MYNEGTRIKSKVDGFNGTIVTYIEEHMPSGVVDSYIILDDKGKAHVIHFEDAEKLESEE